MRETAHRRYAIYYLPPLGSDLARFGATWLGWDVDQARALQSPVAPLTATPRKYGFHGTLKPPFRLNDGVDEGALRQAVVDLANDFAPVVLDGLSLVRLGRFFALTPTEPSAALDALAASCVRRLDPFRAPPSADELARRRAKGLSERQDAHLLRWGYPYVMDQFRFHLTLTGPVPKAEQAQVHARIESALPALPQPYVIHEIALVGERPDGFFETVERIPLGGY